MGTEKKLSRLLWAAPVATVVWIAASAPFSVTVTAWGLAALSALAGAGRWVAPERSAVAIRHRALDVSLFAVFALAFAFLAWTARLG